MGFIRRPIAECVRKVSQSTAASNSNDQFLYIDLSSIDKDEKRIIGTAVQRLRWEDAPSRARQIVQAGDILISTVRPNLNGVAQLDANYDGAIASTGFCVLRTKPDVLDSRYLFHWLCSPKFVAEMVKLATGASYPAVSDRIIHESLIPLPSDVIEQRRIATILDKAEAIRKKRREALKLADEFIRSVYMEVVKNALDADANTYSLLDIFSITTGKLDSNAAESGGQYPFFTCAQETFQINTYAFDREALLLAGNNAIGEYSVKHYKGKFNAYQRTYVLTLKNENHSYGFFRYALESKLRDLKRLSKGSNTKYLTLGILAEQMLVVPDEEAQLRFAVAYQKLELMKESLNSHQAMALDLFSSLADRAFCGQL